MPVASEIIFAAWNFAKAIWWIGLAFLVFYMFSKYYASETIKLAGRKIKLKELHFYSHFLGIFLGLYMFQRFLFSNYRMYFCGASMIFWIVGTMVWMIAKKGRHVMIAETRCQGEVLWTHPKLAKGDKLSAELLPLEFVSENTGMRFIKMPLENYSAKKHFGTSAAENWKFGNVVHTDYFNGEFFWHPEFPELHNINMIARKAFWLKMKKDLPKIRLKMLELTWLREWWLLDSMEQAQNRAWISLQEMKLTHPKPLDFDITNEDLMKKIREKGIQILSLDELGLDKDYTGKTESKKTDESADKGADDG